jgi:hypothetical protein
MQNIVCPMRFVDCPTRGGYNPSDQCRQTCLNEFEDVPEAVMCIKRYVDCSKRGGYDPADTCRQTCLKAEDDPEEMSHKYLQEAEVIELPELELVKMKGEIDAFFAMGPTGTKAVESFLSKQFRLYME